MGDSVSFITLRILTYHDPEYRVFTARCLETGNVATADNADNANALLIEVLQREVADAIKHDNFANLFSAPAPRRFWTQWHAAARKHGKPEVRTFTVDAGEQFEDERQAPGEVQIIRAA